MNIREGKEREGTGEKKVEEGMMGNMTKRGSRGQRKIPVSELEGSEYENGPSQEREKRRPGEDSGRNAGNGKEQEKTVTED